MCLMCRRVRPIPVTGWSSCYPGPWESRTLQPERSGCYRPGHCHDTWYAVCTVIGNFCELLYRSGFKLCLQVWERGCVSTRWSSCIACGIYATVVEQDNSIVCMWCIGVWSLDTLRLCKWHESQKAKLSDYMLCNISELLLNKDSD
jgi:hypothetical protein